MEDVCNLEMTGWWLGEPVLLSLKSSFCEIEGLVEESVEELPCFPALFFDKAGGLRVFAELFSINILFCFAVGTKPLGFFEQLPSFLVSSTGTAWMRAVDGVDGAAWSVAGKKGLAPAGAGWPLTLGSESFFIETFELSSVLSASLLGTWT